MIEAHGTTVGSARLIASNPSIGLLTFAILLRFGLLTAWVTLTVERMLTRVPLTLNVTAWYLESSLAIVILVAMMATYGFAVALASPRSFAEQRT
jgi:predicted Co/Zn/Cd cation transporter (cation efflux family)